MSKEDARARIAAAASRATESASYGQSSHQNHQSAQQSARILNTLLKDNASTEEIISSPPKSIEPYIQKGDQSLSFLEPLSKRPRPSYYSAAGKQETAALKRVPSSSKRRSETDKKAQILQNRSRISEGRVNRDVYELPDDSPMKEKLASKATEKTHISLSSNPVSMRDLSSRSPLELNPTESRQENCGVAKEDPPRRRKAGRPKGSKNANNKKPDKSPLVTKNPTRCKLRSNYVDSKVPGSSPEPYSNIKDQRENIPLDPLVSRLEDTINSDDHGNNHQAHKTPPESQNGIPELIDYAVRTAEPNTELITNDDFIQSIPHMIHVEIPRIHNGVEAPLDRQSSGRSQDLNPIELNDASGETNSRTDKPSFGENNDLITGEVGDDGMHEDPEDTGHDDETRSKNSEDIYESSDDDAESDKMAKLSAATLTLLGTSFDWTKISRAIRDIGVARRRGQRKRNKLELTTDIITDFVERAEEAKELYKNSLGEDVAEGPLAYDTPIQLDDTLEWLETEVEKLTENTAKEEKGAVIQDIYVHAMPALVFLLEEAILARSKDNSRSDPFTCLKEIIGLFNLTLDLYEEAKSWKVKPASGKIPIKNPFRQVIYPELLSIRNAFQTECDRRREKIRCLKQDQVRAKIREESYEKAQRERDKRSKMIEERRGKIFEDVLNFKSLHIARDKSAGVDVSRARQMVPGRDRWTQEQNTELLDQLRRNRKLPGIIR